MLWHCIQKSNASILERIQSPIIYQADEEFLSDILPLAQLHYSRIATIHHYLSMAKKFKSEMPANESYKLKTMFYALRSASVCRWILEKETMPPIEFDKIYKNLSLNTILVDRIETLIDLKQTVDEKYRHEGEEMLMSFIQGCIDQSESSKNSLPTARGDAAALNQLFRKYVHKYDH